MKCQHIVAFAALAGSIVILAAQDAEVPAGRPADALPPAVELERGIFLESIEGELERAVEVYRGLLAREDVGPRTKAEATFRAAECYENLGELLLARMHYQGLIHDQPVQERLRSMAAENLEDLAIYLMEDNGAFPLATSSMWATSSPHSKEPLPIGSRNVRNSSWRN